MIRSSDTSLRGRLSAVVYPGLLGFSVSLVLTGIMLGWSPTMMSGLTVVCAAVVVGLLEQVIPHASRWRLTARSASIDLAHTLVTGSIVAPAVRASLLVLAGGLTSGALATAGLALWPTGLPLLLQVALAVVVADLGAYAGHRFMHATEVGWRIHAVHHSPRALNFLAAARSHPFNATLTSVLENGPLLLLGVPAPVLAVWTVIKATNGLLQHCNVQMERSRWLELVLATPEVHRWHHSVVMEESNSNFGNTTVLWDRLFGTLHLPEGARPGLDVGIASTVVPESYLAHLATPFLLQRYESTGD